MERIAVKFGGSSVASGAQLKKIKAILDSDPRRQIIVVSAPGKRKDDDAKLTDLLYLCHDMAAMATAIAEPFGLIRERFASIIEELDLNDSVISEIDKFGEELQAGCSRDYVSSRGEYFSAMLIAEYLDARFIDPAKFITIKADGTVAPDSYGLLGEAMSDTSIRYVMAGFYGRDAEGNIKTFSRGGSDISGAIAARAAGAVLYENWTDTSGILMADPRIVDNPKPIKEISFREIREMSYMGASVFHDEAILPVREARIPIRICNTNDPSAPGTLITADNSHQQTDSPAIAGIAGRKDFTMISLEKSLMNKEVGYVFRLMGILNENQISFEHCPSSIDSVSIIVENAQLKGLDEVLLETIAQRLEPDNISIERDLALVAVVGVGMVHTVGVSGRIFGALGRAGINVRVINQGASEMNIIIGFSAKDYEEAIRTIYAAFMETAD